MVQGFLGGGSPLVRALGTRDTAGSTVPFPTAASCRLQKEEGGATPSLPGQTSQASVGFFRGPQPVRGELLACP